MDTAPWMERALAHFTRWVEQHEDDPDLLLADAPALVAALRWAVAQHRWRTVLRLGRRVHGALLRGGRWGLALAVISWLVTGSTELSDDAAKAWALHQRGTQKQLTEDQDGTKDLEEAIRLREEFGDQAGRASQGSEAPAPASEAPVHPGTSAGAKVAITLAVAAVVVFVGVLVNRSISQADAPLPAILGPTFTPGPTTTTLTPTTTSTTITATTRITTTTTELTTVTEPETTPPEPLGLPDVTRLTREEAVARLAQANLQAEADETFSDTVPEGVVISQAPAAGELVEPGSTVRLTISRGPEPPETSEPESAPID